MANHRITRRKFLARSAQAAAAATLPTIIPATALGQDGRAAPSFRINVGLIGAGPQGSGDLNAAMWPGDTQIVAVCDVDSRRRDSAKQTVDRHYADRVKRPQYKGCAAYTDFRELLARDDINAVIIGTPDHWHAIIAIEAARAGKDIYCEKPMSLTIREARAMADAVRRYGRVFQTGSQQRSEYSGRFRRACELVRSGYIGKVHTIYVNIGGPSGYCDLPAQPTPEWMDWDLWLGPAPWRPFNERLHPFSWRGYRDYSGGGMTDWGAHHFDIAQWGLGTDDTGPVAVYPPDGKDYPVLTYVYANGVRMLHMSGPGRQQVRTPHGRNVNGVLFAGDKGWVEVNRSHFATSPENLVRQEMGANDVHLESNSGHGNNWLDCIRTRRRCICDVEIGCRSATICHLGNIAYWLGRPIKWDPAKEQILGDEEAARWLDRPKRAPWRL